MTGFFDKLPEISPKKQVPTQKPVFDPYSFLNLRPEPQTAEDRFKEAKELLSAESNTAIPVSYTHLTLPTTSRV